MQTDFVAAERGLISSCFVDGMLHDRVAELITEEDFSDPVMSLMYEVITHMRNRGKTVNALTVGNVLAGSRRYREMTNEDPMNLVAELERTVSPPNNAMICADIIREHTMTRRLFRFSSEVHEIAGSETKSDKKLAEVNALLDPLTHKTEDGFVSYQDAGKTAINEMIDLAKSGGGLIGLSTGYHDIDQITGGLQKSDLIIWGGRPSMGKTLLAMNIANNVSLTNPVLVFSLEMSAAALAQRSVSSLGSLSFTRIRNGQLIDSDVVSIKKAKNEIDKRKLFIDDRGGVSIDQVRSRARVAKRKHGCDLVIVDYLTMISGKGENRTNEIGYVSRGLKMMAKELNCPVICIAQLNRGVDNRADSRPMMSDLRDSGAIEQDADIVVFNYLDEKYNKESHMQGICELIFRKQRNGNTGTVYMDFIGDEQTFATRSQIVPKADDKPSGSAVVEESDYRGGMSFEQGIA